MKTLPVEFRKNGFHYTLFKRGKRSMIYRQLVPAGIYYYEVFAIRIEKERVIKNHAGIFVLPEREIYPGKNDYGKTAWAFRSLDKARIKFKELENAGAK